MAVEQISPGEAGRLKKLAASALLSAVALYMALGGLSQSEAAKQLANLQGLCQAHEACSAVRIQAVPHLTLRSARELVVTLKPNAARADRTKLERASTQQGARRPLAVRFEVETGEE